jgi:hypothetical protein
MVVRVPGESAGRGVVSGAWTCIPFLQSGAGSADDVTHSKDHHTRIAL